ncbi:cytochrome P450 [Nocardia sp. BMG51109]|uniref:cytochrome P450 n=1 Tax=Nocardia sp. BMG51109 TaxID=1056816 RepID=UPI000566516A|nr:cytochrome P450 [Nocardia sp. BMG51109]
MTSATTTVPTAPGRLPLFGHVARLARHPLAFLADVRARGEIVKIFLGTRPVFVVSSPALIRTILLAESNKFDKGTLMDKTRPYLGNGLPNSCGAFHLQQRRLLQPAFHRDRIRGHLETMRTRAEHRTANWRGGQQIPFCQEMHDLTFDIVTRTMFSTSLGPTRSSEFQQALPVAINGSAARALAPASFWEKLPLPSNRRFDAAVAAVHRIVDEVIGSYHAEGVDHGDLLSTLLGPLGPDADSRMPDQHVHDEVISIIMAGTETAATTLSWLFYELALQPEVEQRLATELQAVLHGRPIEFDDIHALEYTNCILTETLRLHTPNWVLMRRAIEPVDVGGIRLERGSEVLFSLTTLHRDPEIYRDPMHFSPNRWLPEQADALPRGAFIPFGLGNRKCIGDSFALTVMTVVVAAIATQWQMSLAPGCRVRETAGATVQPTGLVLRADNRDQSL